MKAALFVLPFVIALHLVPDAETFAAFLVVVPSVVIVALFPDVVPALRRRKPAP